LGTHVAARFAHPPEQPALIIDLQAQHKLVVLIVEVLVLARVDDLAVLFAEHIAGIVAGVAVGRHVHKVDILHAQKLLIFSLITEPCYLFPHCKIGIVCLLKIPQGPSEKACPFGSANDAF
jgi:hypothetical protein